MKSLRILGLFVLLAFRPPGAFAANNCGDACTRLIHEANALQAQGKYQEALETLRTAAKAEPLASLPVSSEAALVLTLSAQVKPERVAEFRDAARGLAGRALRLAADDPIAQEVLRTLDDDGPSPLHAPSPEARRLFDQAETQFLQRHFKEAQQQYEAAAQADPQFSGAWVGVGDCHFNQQDWPRAEAGFRRATEIESRNAQAWRYLADALAMQGKRDAAERALLSAIAADPSQRPNWSKLAAMRAGAGRPLTTLALRRGVRVTADADGKYTMHLDESVVKDGQTPELAFRMALGMSEVSQRNKKRSEQGAADQAASAAPFDMELAAWRMALLTAGGAQAKAGDTGFKDPALQRMRALAHDGQLEPALLLLQFRQSYRPALESWLAAHPDGVREFIDRYGMQP